MMDASQYAALVSEALKVVRTGTFNGGNWTYRHRNNERLAEFVFDGTCMLEGKRVDIEVRFHPEKIDGPGTVVGG